MRKTASPTAWNRCGIALRGVLLAAACAVLSPTPAHAEAILQVFNQSHNEIAARLPEIAEAGYTALWVPPPTKANGGMSVGYDLNDPFDLGNSDLRGTWSTRYGVEADLHNLIEKCHRFGMRVYFDNVMNHRSYDIPGYNESTPTDVYPGMCPEDFHVRTTSDGFYRKWDNVRSWDDEWQVMFLGLSDLLDIAHENYYTYDEYGNVTAGPFNANFGANEGGWHLKPYIVRYAYYRDETWKLFDRMPWPGKTNTDYTIGDGSLQKVDDTENVNLYTGFGNKSWNPEDPATKALIEANSEWFRIHDASNGVSMTLIEHFPNFYKEQVDDYLYRAVRWLIDTTHVDGLRLDAVKHVPYDFFGASYGNDKNSSKYGYLGQAQWQFNMTRGFNDWDDQRDSVFNIDAPRNDLMAFGEHLGAPPSQGPYVDTGMRLVDDRLRNELNWRFSANQLQGFDNEYAGSELGPDCGVMHAQSHDNDYVDRKPLHHAMYFMRRGLGLVYSDGNNHAATLSGSGGAFPRWARTDFLGQWGQRQIPTLLHAHENFARGGQWGRWSSDNFIAWQRGDGGDASGMTMLFQLNSAWDWWETTKVGGEEFPRDTLLYDYASDMYMPYYDGGSEADYAKGYDIQDGKIKLQPNSYAIWSWKNPDPSGLYPSPYPDCFTNTDDRIIAPDSRVVTIMEDGHVVDPVMVVRKDGVDGDPNFNPYNVADTNATDYSYTIAIPRVTGGTNVTLAVKADGSAETLLLRLDGGMDFGNNVKYWFNETDSELRDNPPGVKNDFYLGFESMTNSNWFTRRIWSEKFAALIISNCWIGTRGACTYQVVDGTPVTEPFTNICTAHSYQAPGFVWHSPTAETETVPVDAGKPVTATHTYTAKASVNGQGSADGFGEWVNASQTNGGEGAGWFVHDDVSSLWTSKSGDIKVSLSGFAANHAYGLWAKPYVAGSNPNAEVTRSISYGGTLRSISVDVGMAWDSTQSNSFKGIEFMDAAGNAVFGVNMGGSQTNCYYGAGGDGTWSTDYGTQAFTVTLTRSGNGYVVSGTTRSGGTFAGLTIANAGNIATFKAYMNGVPTDTDKNSEYYKSEDARQLYFDNLTYTATVTTTPTGEGVTDQFALDGTAATIWAKTSQEQGARAFLYYTTDGIHWPEGGGGVPANPATTAIEGHWKTNSADGSWWRFDIPAGSIPAGAALRYKISAFREQNYGGNGWETVWPGDLGDIANKKAMMTLWTIPGLDFTTQSYHKHLDYTSWTTGFKDGYHLVTARMLLKRTDGSPIANTFRQTFYLDTHVPDGRILYPASDGETLGGQSYGLVVQTDDTVEKVYYHITDGTTLNDGVGNGKTTNGEVEWGEATLSGAWNREMATNTAMPKVWVFNYNGIAPANTGDAVIRVRLCEISSTPTNQWSRTDPADDDPDAFHFRELARTNHTDGLSKYVYFSWPSVSNEMVQAGWKVWVRFSGNLVEGANVSPEDVYNSATIYLNSTNNASTNRGERVSVEWSDFSWPDNWDGGKGECQMAFTMPNVFNGDEDFRYNMTVEIDKNDKVEASRMVRHKGPLLPTCIITTPPETDSDGVKWVITMEDSVQASIPSNRYLRETPIVVLTDAEAQRLDLSFTSPADYQASISATPASTPATASNDVLRLDSIVSNGTSMTWTFAWQVTNAGPYSFKADVLAANPTNKFTANSNTAYRSATVRFAQISHVTSTNDPDWDDDGILNTRENDQIPRPKNENEHWTQDQIFDWWSTGKTDPSSPDTDGDGLPDGLELGYRVAPESGTDFAADINGDGWNNYIWDRDPPFYNSCASWEGKGVPGVKGRTEGSGDDFRSQQVAGSTTDPRNPDSDYDGLPDGIEDANRNGWTDGDGAILEGYSDEQLSGRSWPNGKIDTATGWTEVWEETSPNNADSDGDGLSDGYGEDKNGDGWTDMGLIYEDGHIVPFTTNEYARFGIDNNSTANCAFSGDAKPYTSRAIDYGKLFAAYNVTNADAPGGWPRLVILETDPLCKDTDHDSLPDGWEVAHNLDPLNNGVYDFRTGQFGTNNAIHGPKGNPDGDAYLNEVEFAQNKNPRAWDDDGSGSGGGQGTASIHVGAGDQLGSVNDRPYYTEFTEWTLDDLVALDDYNQGGNTSDIFRWGDGYDSSRDLVAFYFRDGGPEDGKLYFRVDLDDLKAFAEESSLNVYVAINYGSYGNGVSELPDSVNCKTEMKWNAVSGVYDSQSGCVYRQSSGESFVVTNEAFYGAYFNSELDSIMWSVNRAAILGNNWVGGTDGLLFQVYTTKDFTNDDGGSGDKGGLNDFADTIRDDWLCSDYWNDRNNIAQNGKYSSCVSKSDPDGDHGKHAKLAIIAHGNQAVEPAHTMHELVDNGQGGGYQRPVKIHNIYTNCPMNLHITPTLAMAMEWAEVGTTNTWYSGPAFNAAIRDGVAKGAFSLLGSTYSDHVIKYFPDSFNASNAAMAAETLNAIYGNGGNVVSTNVFWLSERVADWDILRKLSRMGYQATVIDQTPHVLGWFDRTTALGDDSYKIHRYWAFEDEADRSNGGGMKAFILSSAADQFRFANTDSGLSADLRHLFLRRARAGTAAISSMFYRWEDFTVTENADGYDLNLRWIANHPWIQVVTLDQALVDPLLINNLVSKDLVATNGMAMQDWVHHACNEDYDNWYYGSDRHESLADKQFEIRLGTNMPTAYGDATTGIVKAAWEKVAGITNADVKHLAEATIFASAFETAFHIEDYNDLSRWSFGEYMNPAKGWHWNPDSQDWEKMGLMSMAWRAQSRTRLAAVFSEVDAWAAANDGLRAYSKDVDLDGEKEWILRNNKVMAVFEAEGGIMVGAWLKDGTNVWQMVGNFAAQPETGYETHDTCETNSLRGAAMKDKSIGGSPMTGTRHTVTNIGSGKLSFTGDSLTKTVTLADASAAAFSISYTASGKAMYVRNGLSPDLATLLLRGQAAMTEEASASSVAVTTSNGIKSVTAAIDVTSGSINTVAKDKDDAWDTVNMRNAAQVRDVEVSGTGNLAYSLAFTVVTDETNHDEDSDGMPDWWEQENFGSPTGTDPDGDPDNDGFRNYYEYLAGTDPNNANSYIGWESKTQISPTNVALTFQCISGNTYAVEIADEANLAANHWAQSGSSFQATNTHHTWIDTYTNFNFRVYRLRIPSVR